MPEESVKFKFTATSPASATCRLSTAGPSLLLPLQNLLAATKLMLWMVFNAAFRIYSAKLTLRIYHMEG